MARRLTVLSGSSALQAAFNAVAAVIATKALGPGDRGLMVLGLTISSICGLVGGLGAGVAFRSQLPATRHPSARRNLVSTFTWCSLAGTVLAVVAAVAIVAASATRIDSRLRGGPFLTAAATFAVAQVLQTQIPDGWFADGRFRRGGLAAATMGAGGLVGVCAALMVSRSAATVLLAQALGTMIVGLAEVGALRRAGLVGLARPEAAQVLALLRRGVPALGLTVGLAVVLRADRYLLGAVAGTTAVGVYSLAATLAEVSRILPASVGQLYLRDASTGLGAARLVPATRLAVGAAVVSGLVVTVVGWLVIGPVFGAQFAAVPGLLLLLVPAEVGLAPYLVASRGLLGGGWTAAAGVLGIGGGLTAVTVYAVSARMAGATGVATGSVLVYLGLSLASFDLLRRRVGRQPETVGSG